MLGNSFLVVLVVLLQTSLPLFLFGPIALVNSAIAWYQAQDAKGGGLCAGPVTLPRKKTSCYRNLTALCATGLEED